MTSPLTEISNNFAVQITNFRSPQFLLHYASTTGLTYGVLSVATSINPRESLVFVHIAYLIDLIAAPLFAYYLEPYREVTLVPLVGQVAHLCVSVILAQAICHIFKLTINLKQTPWIGLIFVGSFYISKKIISYIR